MAKLDAWLAYETSTTTGTGPYTLSGEPFSAPNVVTTTFGNVLSDGDQTVYVAHGDGNNFEVILGTWTAATNELSRDQFLFTTNGGDPINWGAGTKSLYAIQDPILSSAFLQSANNLDDLNDPGTAQNNLGIGTAATEDATSFLRNAGVPDQSITGSTLRLMGAGPNRFVAEDDAAGGDAWYGWRTGPDQGVIAHTDDKAIEQDVVTFDHQILHLLSGLTISGASGAAAYIRAGLSSDQTTGLGAGSRIVFNTAFDISTPSEITLNTGTGVFTVPPGVWVAILQVRIEGASNTQGFGQFAIEDNVSGLSAVLTAAVPGFAAFPNSQMGMTFGLVNTTTGVPVSARILGSGDLTAIDANTTQMTIVGFRR